MKRILICDPLDEGALEWLRAQDGLEVDHRPDISPRELDGAIGGVQAVIVRSRTQLRRATLERASSLKVIGRAGTGLDNIDVDYAHSRGIQVLNAPGANADAVAELALALMLMLARRLPEALESVRAGRPRKLKGIELMGKTLGLIGFGHIGRRVAELARGLGMSPIAHDPLLDPAQVPEPLRAVPLCELPSLLGQSDFVSLHVPLLDSTRDLVNPPLLGQFKPGAYLINTARGGLVEDGAVQEALDAGALAGYASDFVAPDSPLLHHPKAILTPHVGASTLEAQRRAGEEVVRRVWQALG